MDSAIILDAGFHAAWPYAGERAAQRLGCAVAIRAAGDARDAAALLGPAAAGIRRLLVGGLPPGDPAALPALRQLASTDRLDAQAWRARGIDVAMPRNEGFWGQSVAEFALGLTIAALRRIPQSHAGVADCDPACWDYAPRPGSRRGGQFGDDEGFVNGSIAGKRIAVIGLGNIGSRYAAWCSAMGAQVSGWDAQAGDPAFHRAGCRRRHRLADLFDDCDILAPMLPLLPQTAGLVDAAAIGRLPRGALVLLVTRAAIVDMAALRRRVLAGELALAADVFDQEPLPRGDGLLGLPHVVHTPHNAGRTRDANRALIDEILDQW